MSNDGDAAYGNTHRAFLQALLSRQTITYTEAKPLLAAIQTAATPDRPTLDEDVSQQDFDNYIHAVHAQISPFDFEIRNTKHQESQEQIYALVNTTSDGLTQMATIHTADEIAFVKRVLDAMFETYNTPRAEVMAVTSMQALKLAKPPADENRRDSGTQTQSAQTGLTMNQAEKVLSDLVAEGWLEKSARNFYTLTPRALMELRGWLRDTYNDQQLGSDDEDEDVAHEKIKSCRACQEIVTTGQRCPNMSCPIRFHTYCTRTFWPTQSNREECPTCKTAWVDAPPVGEKAAKHGRRSTANGTGGRRSTNGAPRESDAGADAED